MLRLFTVVLILLTLTSLVCSQTTTENVFSESGKVIEKEIAPQQIDVFRLRLEVSDFVKVEALPKNCDIILQIYSLDDKSLIETKNENSINESEVFAVAPKLAGNYKVRVANVKQTSGVCSYQLRIIEKRPANEKDFAVTSGKIITYQLEKLIKADSSIANLQLALDEYQKALNLFRFAGNRQEEATVLFNLGIVYSKLGNRQKSAETQKTALNIFQEIDDKNSQSLTLISLGRTYSHLGEREKALTVLQENLLLARQLKNKKNEALALSGIGSIYSRLKESAKAENYFSRSLAIFQEIEDVYNQALVLNYLGNIRFDEKNYSEAANLYQKAIELEKTISSRESNPSYINNLGNVLISLGEIDKGLQYVMQALSISQKRGNKINEAHFYRTVAKAYFKLEKLQEAEKSLEQSLEIYRSIEAVTRLSEVLFDLAKVKVKLGKTVEAQTHFEESLQLIEEFRSHLKTTELRDSFSPTFSGYYGTYTEFLLTLYQKEPQESYAEKAWQASEKGKSRTLLNLLNEANAEISEGIDAELLKKERETFNLLNARLENLTQVIIGKKTSQEIELLKQEVRHLRLEHQIIQAKIREKSPRFAGLTQTPAVTLKEVQNKILDENTVLLSFSLGTEKSFLWFISRNQRQIYELPNRLLIEEKTREFYRLLTARNTKIKFETPEEKSLRITEADAELQKLAAELYKILLGKIEPVLLRKRILIVAEGVLHYLPFASLLTPNGYLVENNEIINLPSVSTLISIQHQKNFRQAPTKLISVLADPVFDKNDSRFALNKKISKNTFKTSLSADSNEQPKNFLRDFQDFDEPIARLPFTRKEAEAVARFIPQNQRQIALDFAATRQLALSAELGKFRIVHFATHGFLNSQNPELSGLVLSLVDEKGNEINGFLRADEIFNMKLSAELVVLSGCKTGLGKEIQGEGLVGMTRGLMYAGASRVIVSLWDVNDAATAEIMSQFYQNLLVNRQFSYSQSWRQAQISLIRSKNFSSPYYWAAFTLHGEI